MDAERWIAVEGYEGLYEVSDAGRVRSIRRPGSGCGRPHLGRVLRQRLNTVGYPVVNLYRGTGKPKTFMVHRLVARAFLPNPRWLRVVMHLDNDKTNNALMNLCWGTHADNSAQAYADGLNTPPVVRRGSSNENAKLNESRVRVIRRARKIGVPLAVLAEAFGVSVSNVCSAANGRCWAHVEHGGPLA